MAYLVLARKYRPQTFADVIEQKQTTQTLTNAITTGRVAHALLFSGPRGTGKTTIARIMAKAMNCEQGPTPTPCNQCRSCLEITSGNAADVYEIDGASNNSVDQIRELRSNIKFMPAHSPYKIYIIDEVHMLTASAFNALLKTLEEPPPHVMFEFATTEPHKIPITILSRCQRYDLSYVPLAAIVDHLARLCTEEGFQIDNRGLELIAREAGGSIRDALSLLDQVMSCTDRQLTHDQIVDMLGITNRENLFAVSEAALSGDLSRILDLIDEMYRSGLDIKKIYADIMSHFRDLLLVRLGTDMESSSALPAHEVDRIRTQIADRSEFHLHQILTILLNEEKTVRYSSQPKIAMEMAFIRICQLQPPLPVDTLIEKIEALKDRLLTLPAHSDDPGEISVPLQAAKTCDVPGGTALKETPQASAFSPPAAVPAEKNPENPVDSSSPSPATEIRPAKARVASGRNMNPAEAWQAILAIIDDEHPLLASNLKNSTLSAVHGNKLEIDISGSKMVMNILTAEENISTLKKICSAFYEKEMAVRLNHKVRTKAVRQPQPKKPAGIHPLVMDALDIFGGDILTNKT